MVTNHSSSGDEREPHGASPTKAEFAERLRAAIERKGWSPSETARQVSQHLGRHDRFSRAHLWQYLQGKSFPRTRYLRALSRALDVRPEDLVPSPPSRRTRVAPDTESSPTSGAKAQRSGSRGLVHVRDYGDGTALVQVAERVSWETALAVIELLKKPSDDTSSE